MQTAFIGRQPAVTKKNRYLSIRATTFDFSHRIFSAHDEKIEVLPHLRPGMRIAPRAGDIWPFCFSEVENELIVAVVDDLEMVRNNGNYRQPKASVRSSNWTTRKKFSARERLLRLSWKSSLPQTSPCGLCPLMRLLASEWEKSRGERWRIMAVCWFCLRDDAW